MAAAVPPIFAGRTLRSGVKYTDLRYHKFTTDEHCSILLKNGTSPQQRGRLLSMYCQRHFMRKIVILSWIIAHSGYGVALDDCPIDGIGVKAIIAFYQDDRLENENIQQYSTRAIDMMMDQHSKTMRRSEQASTPPRLRMVSR